MRSIFMFVLFIFLSVNLLVPGMARKRSSEFGGTQALKCKTIEFLNSQSQCTQQGTYPILGSCTSYIQCYQAHGRQKLDSIEIECSPGHGFDVELKQCVDAGSWNIGSEGCEQTQCQSILARSKDGTRAHRQYYGSKGFYGSRQNQGAPPNTPPSFLPDCPPESVEEEPEFGHNPFYSAGKVQNLNCNPVQGRYDEGRTIPPPPPPPPQRRGPYPGWVPTQERATLGYNDPRYRFPTTTTEPSVIWPANPTRRPYAGPQASPPTYQPRPNIPRTTTTETPEYRPAVETRRPYVNNQTPPRKPEMTSTEVNYQEPEYRPAVETQRPYVNNQTPPRKPEVTSTEVNFQEPEYKPVETQRPYVNSKSPPRKPEPEYPEKDRTSTTEAYHEHEREPMTTKPNPDHPKHPPATPETTTSPPEQEAQNPAEDDYEERSPVSSQQGTESHGSKLLSGGHYISAIIMAAWLIA